MEAKAKAESELDELRDRVEVMALDKEMAEERAEVAELGKLLHTCPYIYMITYYSRTNSS